MHATKCVDYARTAVKRFNMTIFDASKLNRSISSLPKEVDWRTMGAVSSVKDSVSYNVILRALSIAIISSQQYTVHCHSPLCFHFCVFYHENAPLFVQAHTKDMLHVNVNVYLHVPCLNDMYITIARTHMYLP